MPAYTHVPKGYSQTKDCFAGVLGGAPEFRTNGMTVEQAFNRLDLGILSVIGNAKNPQAIRLLEQCRSEAQAVRDMFLANSEKDKGHTKEALLRLSRAYYDLYVKAGEMLKPGVEIGPDDDV